MLGHPASTPLAVSVQPLTAQTPWLQQPQVSLQSISGQCFSLAPGHPPKEAGVKDTALLPFTCMSGGMSDDTACIAGTEPSQVWVLALSVNDGVTLGQHHVFCKLISVT